MTDLPHIPIELEQQGELARLTGGVLQQDAVGVRRFHEDVAPEGLRDHRHLQVAVIALVVVDDVILDAVRVEALRLPLGVQGQGHRTRESHGSAPGVLSIVVLGQRRIVDVADIELDFVVLIGAAHADTSIS